MKDQEIKQILEKSARLVFPKIRRCYWRMSVIEWADNTYGIEYTHMTKEGKMIYFFFQGKTVWLFFDEGKWLTKLFLFRLR